MMIDAKMRMIERNHCELCSTCIYQKIKNLVGKLIIFTNIQSKPQRIKGLVVKCYRGSSVIWNEFCSFYFIDNRSVKHSIGSPYVDMNSIEILPPEENLIFRLQHNISIR